MELTFKKIIVGASVCVGISTFLRTCVLSDESEDTFRELLSDLTLGATPAAVLERLAERTAALVRAGGVYVERLDKERQELVAVALHGEDLPPVGSVGPYPGSVAEQAITSGNAVIVENIGIESRSILGGLRQSSPALVLPIITNHSPVGALVVMRKRGLSKKDVARLRVFANLAAISLRRAMTLEQVEQQREELEKALQAREQLLRMLAHELRNPVNTIAIAASVLRNYPPEQAVPKLLEIIDRSTSRMNRLIQDLLDEAVIERTGALPINLQRYSAQVLTEDVCEITRLQAQSKTVEVQCDIKGRAVVRADRDRFLQVLMNLIDNALKFTPQGGRVTIRSELHDSQIRFSVSDTGPGIPDAFRDKVFEPYFQVPGMGHQGSGLGLAIAKRIVEQHGGQIWFESIEGEGTTFVVTLPAEPLVV